VRHRSLDERRPWYRGAAGRPGDEGDGECRGAGECCRADPADLAEAGPEPHRVGVGQHTFAGRVEHGVHRAQRADPASQARAVPHWCCAQLAGERFIMLADSTDHLDPTGDRELRRDNADGSAAAEQQQRLPALDVQQAR
jgi:hypothetical protein